MQRTAAIAVFSALIGPLLEADLNGQRPLIELQVSGQLLSGVPVGWSSTDVMLLGRDGRLWELEVGEVKQYRRLSESFTSLSAGELRAQLLAEFGRSFDVSGTAHYLVVHPAGQRDRWASRFEQLYRSFMHYLAARGFTVNRPEFPLVAVVFPNRAEFLDYARSSGAKIVSGTLGFYSPTSNRVLLYDVAASEPDREDLWYLNSRTIIHEAAHQSAFNCGIHGRFAMTPRWIVEGLGTSFEADGVWDSGNHRSRQDRVNQDQLESFRRIRSRRPAGYLSTFVSSDRPFHANTEAAYAEAWALTFFLIETRPRQYFDLLRRTAELPAFEAYRSPDRLNDFVDVFGKDLEILESHFLRFIDELSRF